MTHVCQYRALRLAIARSACLLAALFGADARAGVRAQFGFDTVISKAQELALEDYVEPDDPPLPEVLEELDYDRYRELRFRPERALFAGPGERFRAMLFHRGYLFRHRVRVHVIEGEQVREIGYDPELFSAGTSGVQTGELAADLGFAGFRLHFPLNRPEVHDEVIAFLGASYFRVLGTGQVYGLSARGLAVDTAEASGEEFPLFREFWIERPAPDAERIRVFGLLDGPSLAGAYLFVIEPGAATRVEVSAFLVPRRRATKLGIAPLTSMFLFGENRARYFPDFRPEVHDSDGLLVELADGERLWRPLDNPPQRHRVSRFPAPGLRGFGLLQRDRVYASYEDLESRFERRPNLWVEPLAGFDAGAVELVEIPTPTEYSDNVAAYFVPDGATDTLVCASFRYALIADLAGPRRSDLAEVTATRVRPASNDVPALFVLSFAGGDLDREGGEEPALTADVQATAGAVRNVVLMRDSERGGVRLTFEVSGPSGVAVGLRARLLRGERRASETWVYEAALP